MIDFDQMFPRQIVEELDKYIIGQSKAKKAVAIAIRNRTRRQSLPEDLRDEVAPKNIILIGPTGVGKTEIARRISRLSGAPFIKVEATKYTEVGYVGRDVESMVRDLMHVGINMVRTELQESVRAEAEARAEELLLDLLMGKPSEAAEPKAGGFLGIDLNQIGSSMAKMGISPEVLAAAGIKAQGTANATENPAKPAEAPTDTESHKQSRERMRAKLRAGQLDDREVEVNVNGGGPSIEIFSGNSMEELDLNLGGLSNLLGKGRKKKRLGIKRAREVLIQEELDKLVDHDRIAEIARERVQNMGIIFIDEIDKIANRSSSHGADVSREGVQRDILPIVEGCQVNTKYGLIDTRHILFIAAGAFHMSKPSDLIPELQGRFPIRVELESLGRDEFLQILTRPANAITRQYIELLKTEGLELEFAPEALALIASMAADVNASTENIGARRLQTVMEHLLEDISFTAPERSGEKIVIDATMVREKLGPVAGNQDISRYIL